MPSVQQQTPADRCCCCRLMGQTDRQTDERTPDCYTDPAQYTVHRQNYEKYGEAVALLTVKHAMYNVTVNGNEKFT